MVQANTNQPISDERRNLITSGLVGGVLLSTGCTDYIGTGTEEPDKPPTADPDPPKVCYDEFTPFERLDPGESIILADFDIMKDVKDDFKQTPIGELSSKHLTVSGEKYDEIDKPGATPINLAVLRQAFSINITEEAASEATDKMENNRGEIYKKAEFRIKYDGRELPVGLRYDNSSEDKFERYTVALSTVFPYQVSGSDFYIPGGLSVSRISKTNCENAIRYASKHIANSLEPNKESTLDEKIVEFEQNNEHGWGGSSLL